MGAITSRTWATGHSSDLKLDSVIKLPNGVTMPRLGFGVWQVDQSICTSVVEKALNAGYRHVDSAQAYRNEAEAGAALRSVKLSRRDVFFTTKIPRDLGSVDANYASLAESVRKINGIGGGSGDDGDDDGHGPDAQDAYVDLFLIHSPEMGPQGIKNVWLALERLLGEGKTRSIGVSNFNGEHIEGMKEYATVWPPHVNQIEVRASNTPLYFGTPLRRPELES
jgi:diketogulonate reductase-like aldo/keto reductase